MWFYQQNLPVTQSHTLNSDQKSLLQDFFCYFYVHWISHPRPYCHGMPLPLAIILLNAWGKPVRASHEMGLPGTLPNRMGRGLTIPCWIVVNLLCMSFHFSSRLCMDPLPHSILGGRVWAGTIFDCTQACFHLESIYRFCIWCNEVLPLIWEIQAKFNYNLNSTLEKTKTLRGKC